MRENYKKLSNIQNGGDFQKLLNAPKALVLKAVII